MCHRITHVKYYDIFDFTDISSNRPFFSNYFNCEQHIMTETIKARYRNKLAKVIIEVWNGEKWLYVKTLRDPLTEFSAECLEKVSHSSPVLEEKTPQKFGQSLLNEQPKQDIKEALKLVDDVISPRKEGMPDE